MRRTIYSLLFVALGCPAHAQVKTAINRSSIYADSVLRQLVRASQHAASRQQSILGRSALQQNETTVIRRQSALAPTDLAQLERLSSFSGDRLRSLEEQSEFREREISRMQAAFQASPATNQAENRLADLAEKNSTMPRSQVLSLMSTSDARDWAERVRRRALAVGGFSDLLQKRSLASTTRSRVIRQMSQDK